MQTKQPKTDKTPSQVHHKNEDELKAKSIGKDFQSNSIGLTSDLFHPMTANSQDVIFARLQQISGNQHIQRLIKHDGGGIPSIQWQVEKEEEPIQTKLKISQPGDRYELEADRVAKQIMSIPESKVQRLSEVKKDVKVQTKSNFNEPANINSGIGNQINLIKNRGRPLPVSVRNFFEPRFGYDFKQVKIYTDSKASKFAKDLNANAITVGQNILFDQGQFVPDSIQGKELIAHELVHVQQQSTSKYNNSTNSTRSIYRKINSEKVTELEWERRNKEGRTEHFSTPDYEIFILWNFGVGQSYLKPNFELFLDEFIENEWRIHRIFPWAAIVIEGHASNSGLEHINQSLSEKRSSGVEKYIKERIDETDWDRISKVGYGEIKPREPNISGYQKAKNRRVEIKITKAPRDKPKKRKELPPPEAKKSEGSFNYWKLIPGVRLDFGVKIPGGAIPLGDFMLYTSGNIDVRVGLETPSAYKFNLAADKEGVAKKIQFDITNAIKTTFDFTKGRVSLKYKNSVVTPEIYYNIANPIKPVGVAFSKEFKGFEVDFGKGVSIKGDYELKLNIDIGPGPGLAAKIGASAPIAAGAVAGTWALLYLTAKLKERAERRGERASQISTMREGYSWYLAGILCRGYSGYGNAFKKVESMKRRENYPFAYLGWQRALESIEIRSSKDKEELIDNLRLKFGDSLDPDPMQDKIFRTLGWYADEPDAPEPPKNVEDLLKM